MQGKSDGTRFYVLLGTFLILSVFGGIAVWSAVAPIDGTVMAPATVRVETNRKAVQHLEGGIVSEIVVSEGESVQAGDLLARLDDTVASANLKIVEGQLDELVARRARLIAERDNAKLIAFPRTLTLRSEEPEVADILKGQLGHFDARRATRHTETDLLRQRMRQLEDKIGGLRAQNGSKAKQIGILGQEIRSLRALHEKGYAPITRILALERDAERLRGERGEHMAEIAEAHNAIGEAEMEIVRIEKTFQEEVIAELRDVQARIAELSEQRVAAEDQFRRGEILAPRQGTILGLAVHTLGGVVRAGEPLMYIVPEDDRWVIEAQVSPHDIDKVTVGSEAFVRFSAFNQRLTPELAGQVVRVSGDSMVNDTTGAPYYSALVDVPEQTLLALKDVKLVPGMPAEVFIRTGERSAISYLVKPLVDGVRRAMREE